MANVDELVHVETAKPFSFRHKRVVIGPHQRGFLNPARFDPVVDDMGPEPHLRKPLPDRIRAVIAIIGVDEELIDTDGQMIRHPLKDERALVLHGCDEQLHLGKRIGRLRIFC